MSQLFHYVIGDIHGCLDELLRLEKKIKKHSKDNNAKPLIISCGDLIDRGPKSNEVVEHFYQGSINKTHLSVMGNHEILLLSSVVLNKPDLFKSLEIPYWFDLIFPNALDEISTELKKELNEEMLIWIPQGGTETLKSYGVLDVFDPDTWKLPKEHIQYLLDLPIFLNLDKIFISHALPMATYVKPIEDLQKDFEADQKINIGDYEVEKKMLNHFLWNRNHSETKPVKGKINVSGHTPMHGIKRTKGKKVLQIDTACYQGGFLTAYCLEKNSFLKVKHS